MRRGGHDAAVGCDVTAQAGIQAAVAAVAAVGVLINSAGAAVPGSARVWRREAELAADDAGRFFDWPVGCGQLPSASDSEPAAAVVSWARAWLLSTSTRAIISLGIRGERDAGQPLIEQALGGSRITQISSRGGKAGLVAPV